MIGRILLTKILAAASFSLLAAAQAPTKDTPTDASVRPVVIELFSSQSCGNCPGANENVRELASRNDIIVLTYPVGYWNYLGWDDSFAKPEFAERQKAYNRSLGHRGPYTPQAIYSGRLHSSAVDREKIERHMNTRNPKPFPVTVLLDHDKVNVNGPADLAGAVVLVRFKPGDTTVTPQGGKNKGLPMTYFNLVTGVEVLGDWSGGTADYPAPDCNEGCTVLVQAGGATGGVIGAREAHTRVSAVRSSVSPER